MGFKVGLELCDGASPKDLRGVNEKMCCRLCAASRSPRTPGGPCSLCVFFFNYLFCHKKWIRDEKLLSGFIHL